jgi:hypothetical protein
MLNSVSIRVIIRKFFTLLRIVNYKIRQIPRVLYIWIIELNLAQKNESPEESFHAYAADLYSQVGQDGIIQEMFKRLGIYEGTFCEFGAWDGMHLSNARKLIGENWSGVFIEGNPERFQKLVQNYPSANIIKINAWVGYHKSGESNENNLHELLRQNVSGEYIENLDLLVIDVDGVDLEIAMSSGVRAKLVLIEGGSSFVPSIDHPFSDAAQNFQHPLTYIVNQLGAIGYVPLCFRQDLFLVRRDLADIVLQGRPIYSAEELFSQNFYSLPRAERRWQMLRRFNNPKLREFEITHTKRFHPNPMRFLQ